MKFHLMEIFTIKLIKAQEEKEKKKAGTEIRPT